MPRIRSMKPEFCSSERIAGPGGLSIPCRLHFAMLWTYTDDQGRGVDNPRLIKAALWPLDDDITAVEVEAWQAELAAKGRITRYEVDGRRYYLVANFKEHQKPSKPQPSKLPEPPQQGGEPFPDPSGNGSGTSEGVDIPKSEKPHVTDTNGALPDDSRNVPGALPLGVVDGEGEGVGGEREGNGLQSAVTATGPDDVGAGPIDRRVIAASQILGLEDHAAAVAAGVDIPIPSKHLERCVASWRRDDLLAVLERLASASPDAAADELAAQARGAGLAAPPAAAASSVPATCDRCAEHPGLFELPGQPGTFDRCDHQPVERPSLRVVGQ